MEKDLISVVIPVYNAEEYIKRCLESIQKQTYDNLEIIVVNDGSTDHTQKVVGEMQQQDERIKLIQKENEGVSAARNDGVLAATGKYIYFIDSDDYVEDNIVEKLYEAISTQGQLSVCGFTTVFMKKEDTPFSLYDSVSLISIEQYLEKMSQYLYSVYFGSLWNKMYVTEIIKSNQLKFRKDISLAEDFIFNLDYLQYVKKVTMLPECMYYYYQGNEESLTKKSDPWYIWDMARIRLQYCMQRYGEMNMLESCKRNISTMVANELVGPTYDIINNEKWKIKQTIKKLKELYQDTFTKEAIKETKNPQMVHRIAKVSLGMHSYFMFYILMKIWVKIQRYNPEK
ncbi:MAG: glycosyltransferase family 2 protein [Eubacterium sp.]|nr:glycosyltransferase family 2 protein [Eubacterium sp.]